MASLYDAADVSSDLDLQDTAWLSHLSHHPIFSARDGAGEEDGNAGLKPSALAVRHADILVAHGTQLRMASLLEVKHRSTRESSTHNQTQYGSYKRLVSPALDFDIARLVVNPTGKLVVAIGAHKLAVVVLPRPGALASASQPLHPRSASTSREEQTTIGEINVKAALVGPFYHHERIGGRHRLADAKWHPWGDLGSSLLVMSRDGILREYDVSKDLEEPVQTITLLPTQGDALEASVASTVPPRSFRSRSRSRSRSVTPGRASGRGKRSTSRFALDDDDASWDADVDGADDTFYTANASVQSIRGPSPSAVAFSLGIDERSETGSGLAGETADWTPLTVYALCSTGDIFSLCPFMPQSAILSTRYLHNLSSFVSASLSEQQDLDSAAKSSKEYQARFVSALLKQARQQHQDRQSVAPEESQQHLRASSATPMSMDEARASNEPQMRDFAENVIVNVQAPSEAIVPRQALVQGPYLLTPEPHELSDRLESVATDIFFSKVASTSGDSLKVIGIASTNGKIDLCLALDGSEPVWKSSSLSEKRSKKKSGRYALSDSESEGEYVMVDNTPANDASETISPTLLVYESIDLGFLDAIKGQDADVEKKLKSAPLCFSPDPIYSDVVYVQHIAGAHAIGFGKWSRALIAARAATREDVDAGDQSVLSTTFESPSSSKLARFMHQERGSEVIWVAKTIPETGLTAEEGTNPMRGLCIVSDLYLCYSFLALAQNGALVALELTLRAEESDDSAATAHVQQLRIEDDNIEGDNSPIPPTYTSLLGDGPAFTVPEPFKNLHGMPLQPHSALKPPSASIKGELRVTPETLRAFATIVQDLRGQIRKIVQGANSVQSRLELQMEELKRQLGKLDDVAQRVTLCQKGHSVKGDSQERESLDTRIKRVMSKQGELARRSDRLLQRLIENHSPELSIYERRWLEELERLSEQLGHSGAVKMERQITIGGTRAMPKSPMPGHSNDETEASGLSARLETLRYRLDVLKPELELALQSRTASDRANSRSGAMLGTQQLQGIEAMLAAEGKLLLANRTKISHLNTAIRRQTAGLGRAS